MPGRKILCKVIDKKWLTPTVMQIRFVVLKRFHFEAGQFISLIIPGSSPSVRPVRRIYSLSSAPHESEYELCVKYMGGPGTEYLKLLGVGDKFEATAPYGDLIYDSAPERDVMFICTGTGIAPFKSMVLSERFQKTRPHRSYLVFGARTSDEVIYPGLFENQGLRVTNAISGDPTYPSFKGRVTDYLKSLPSEWQWENTDFYLCGNGAMVNEAVRFLTRVHCVPVTAIRKEIYFESVRERASDFIKIRKKAA